MTSVEKVLEDLPKDADTLRHVQEWVNSAVTDETDGAESEDQRDANFYLTHPFLDLVSGRSSNWHSVHARVGGVQPLNQEANLEMALFGVSNFERRF